jgi:hypothetical protein
VDTRLFDRSAELASDPKFVIIRPRHFRFFQWVFFEHPWKLVKCRLVLCTTHFEQWHFAPRAPPRAGSAQNSTHGVDSKMDIEIFAPGIWKRFDGLEVLATHCAEDSKGEFFVVHYLPEAKWRARVMRWRSTPGFEAWNDQLELPQIPAHVVPNDFHGATGFVRRFTFVSHIAIPSPSSFHKF